MRISMIVVTVSLDAGPSYTFKIPNTPNCQIVAEGFVSHVLAHGLTVPEMAGGPGKQDTLPTGRRVTFPPSRIVVVAVQTMEMDDDLPRMRLRVEGEGGWPTK